MNATLPDWPGHCFGCSPRNPLGLHLRFERTAEGCRTSHSVSDRHCGIEGIAHGGIVSTLLDETAAWAIILHSGRLGLTTRMGVEFVKPVPTATPLELEAWIVSRDGKRATTRAEVRDGDGAVLAHCAAEWALASAAVVSRMSGLDRSLLAGFFAAAHPSPAG